MYSSIKNVQLLIALLKEYNIKKVVISPGGSNIPIIHSVETDDFFECYSVVDERSSVYFAIGLSQISNEPVACMCTSGTAASNYLPGLTEAYYQSVPIVAITADKNPYFLDNLETQKIKQDNLFISVCKKSVNLPLVKDSEEEWYCKRLINEALLELDHNGKKPVHINIPIVGNTTDYSISKLPVVGRITYLNKADSFEKWKFYVGKLLKAKRILLIIGQNVGFSKKDEQNIEKFFSIYNCAISVEHLSNLKCNGTLYTYPLTEIMGAYLPSELAPDIIISMGNNISSYNMKPFLRNNAKKIEHWQIDEGGRVRDVFQCLTMIIESKPSYFFDFFINSAPEGVGNKLDYYSLWNKHISNINMPDFDFSHFYVAKKLAEIIPENSILHLAILNSIRIMQFFQLSQNTKVYGNIGALGIDGCLSTFIGQATSTSKLAFCVIGDLSFFYDMNALGIKHIDKNVRIILLNNCGGGEFHFFVGKEKIPTINSHICAEHEKSAKGWAESLGFKYYAASTKDKVNEVLDLFASESKHPLLLEVKTDMELDAQIAKDFYASNISKKILNKSKVAKLAGKVLNDSQKDMAKKIINKIKKG